MLSVDRDKARHYGDECGRHWSVSQVVDVVTGGCEYYAPGSAERGLDIHDIFALMIGAQHGLSELPEVPREYAGYADAIRQWAQASHPIPLEIERSRKHAVLPYAGTPDLIGMIGGQYGVLDLKTGSPARWHSLQVHGYQKMLDPAARMWVLYVANDGSYRQVMIKLSARDWAAFQNGLSILRWREAA